MTRQGGNGTIWRELAGRVGRCATRHAWLIVIGVGLAAFVAVAVSFYLIFSGPYMVEQAHIRAFQAPMPLPAEGTVPVEPTQALPTAREAATVANSVSDTPENRARGGVYYQYYCLFCHGAKGDGNGPVAESYLPPPPDLRTPKVQALSDGELLRAMILGPGHEPVLAYTVLPAHRWYLVTYVRSLAPPPPAP